MSDKGVEVPERRKEGLLTIRSPSAACRAQPWTGVLFFTDRFGTIPTLAPMTCKADPPMFHVSDLLTPALTRPRWPSVSLTRRPDTDLSFPAEGNALVKRTKTTHAETREAHSWTHTLESIEESSSGQRKAQECQAPSCLVFSTHHRAMTCFLRMAAYHTPTHLRGQSAITYG
ncbi:uncharacterized protein LY79DRAFT_206774 [Colletotrichum navitas]|uniref:Uncharacterized protein n=1 Tax=Colletotrichum navitas TaxID=681940 RepID=A0AAD8VBG8_9PEZI|nr:uncharacterized protein LY79DRAFT_206774 [Colletotrichum navitas]KAK1599058.1 hypothetical protein LY79DRAFT_206774 [Colletotrichum navitas]